MISHLYAYAQFVSHMLKYFWTHTHSQPCKPCDIDRCYQINIALQWRHNGRDDVWNHYPHHCLLTRLFRRRSKKASKLGVTDLWGGGGRNSSATGEFPAQMTSNAENVSVWWRHHGRKNNQMWMSIIGWSKQMYTNFQRPRSMHHSTEPVISRSRNTLPDVTSRVSAGIYSCLVIKITLQNLQVMHFIIWTKLGTRACAFM